MRNHAREVSRHDSGETPLTRDVCYQRLGVVHVDHESQLQRQLWLINLVFVICTWLMFLDITSVLLRLLVTAFVPLIL